MATSDGTTAQASSPSGLVLMGGPEAHSCCAPSRSGQAAQPVVSAGAVRHGVSDAEGLVWLDGGEFLMGSEDPDGFPADGEGPVRRVTLRPFRIDPVAVSTARFAAFVDATSYVTEAERYGWSFVFAGLLPDDFPATRGSAQAPWWRQVFGADWRHPEGPQSSIEDRGDHPVVHVAYTDALAYCAWAGARLPTEAEWEYAARGGLEQARFPWGDELTPDGEHRCNVWQGSFPAVNSLDDGFLGTAPVNSYEPNGFGLYNVAGNVWEWCADWFHPSLHRRGPQRDPVGPASGSSKVVRGGSYLCHASYCNRYRVAARTSNNPDSSTGNMGFRIARDA
jgi:sulfatase modifying factor 1